MNGFKPAPHFLSSSISTLPVPPTYSCSAPLSCGAPLPLPRPAPKARVSHPSQSFTAKGGMNKANSPPSALPTMSSSTEALSEAEPPIWNPHLTRHTDFSRFRHKTQTAAIDSHAFAHAQPHVSPPPLAMERWKGHRIAPRFCNDICHRTFVTKNTVFIDPPTPHYLLSGADQCPPQPRNPF